jgi:8-oxo-dGTP pyrophosphatase MutT (NUDIX family)
VIPEYYVRESNGFVITFALTPQGKVVLGNEYRYGADEIGVELPAGNLHDGEDPHVCARRELLEESGYSVDSLEFLGAYYHEPVRSNSKVHVFLARGARRVAQQQLDPTERIETFEATLDELRAMMHDGRISSFGSIAAAYVALDHLSHKE